MEIRKCLYCGKEFSTEIKCRKYCTDSCRETAHWKRTCAKRREATLIKHELERAKKNRVSELSRLEAEARKLGLSYGQYDMLKRMGKIS